MTGRIECVPGEEACNKYRTNDYKNSSKTDQVWFHASDLRHLHGPSRLHICYRTSLAASMEGFTAPIFFCLTWATASRQKSDCMQETAKQFSILYLFSILLFILLFILLSSSFSSVNSSDFALDHPWRQSFKPAWQSKMSSGHPRRSWWQHLQIRDISTGLASTHHVPKICVDISSFKPGH